MAYLFESSARDHEILDYELKGGNPQLTIQDLKHEGRPLKDSGLATCFNFSQPVPPKLMPAVPTRVVVRPASDGFIPDFGMVGPVVMFDSVLVSDRFVELVEGIEPGVHQFIPINECIDVNGRPLSHSFFLMNVLIRLAAIDVERSHVEWKTTRFPDQTEITTLHPKLPMRLVLRRDVVDGHHLWRGAKDGLLGRYFMSDTLHELTREAGLSALRLTKCEEM